jgi:putative FmdB family regulatory protein
MANSQNHLLETDMPLYEYVCQKCSHEFAVAMTINEHDKKRVQCPQCNSTEVARTLQPFYAKTSKKS